LPTKSAIFGQVKKHSGKFYSPHQTAFFVFHGYDFEWINYCLFS